ncbi:MAG: EAL domain-containing protein, partial [Mesorhizobium sp.]
FQPILNIGSGEIVGAEALMRWRSPSRGLVSPENFIAAAEETGLIVQLGDWALRKACSVAAHWPPGMRMAVNVSAAQIKSGGFARSVISALAFSGLPANRLELEITETVMMDESDAVLRTLSQLRGLGVRIALDDFGTGYSSLSYLTRFPFDTIKIDKSFVDDATPKRAVLLKSMVNMAHELGLSVVAEGISDESDALELRQMGCEYVQSFMFGAPMPGDQVLKTLREQYPLTQA